MAAHLERNLVGGVPEELALERRDLELERRGLPRAVSSGEGARAPWRAAADFAEVGELREGGRVTKGYKDDAVVGEGGDRSEDGALCERGERVRVNARWETR